MKFGRLPLSESLGTVLAHTLRLPGGGAIKKGRVLDAKDLARLAEAGQRSVVVAQLQEGDRDEDAAARAIGEAVAGDGVVLAPAFTGRSNLFASVHGLAVIEAAAVERVNRLHEAVTLATVAPYAHVDVDDMVATVKVITFALDAATVASAVQVAGAHGPVVRVAPLTPHRAGLILTRLPGVSDKLLDRAESNTQTRLAELGSELARVVRCPHREAAVSRAIEELVSAGCAPILLLGASAIVDRADVIPAAIVASGGQLEHFGMPVDPGNLLLLARRQDTPLVGVPGCARSLNPSGFDWVLERLLAGLPVGSREIMAMGAGGLLKEVSGRPQPRARAATAPQPASPRVAAVVLAAGRSQRMGEANKLLIEVEQRPMVARVVDALSAARVDEIVVVTGHEAERVRAALSDRSVRFVHNPDFADGMSGSLRLGIEALDDSAEGALVCLGDMPWVRASHVDALIDAFEPDAGRAICVPYYDRKRGNPVLWGRRFFNAMTRLRGDVGARQLLQRHGEAVHRVAMDDGAVLIDIDTPEALSRLGSETDPA